AVCLVLGVGRSVRADDQADVKAVIDKAVKAVGGREKLTKYKGRSTKIKGKISLQGAEIEFTAESHVQDSNKLRSQFEGDFNGMKFTRIQIVNGDKGWVSMMGTVNEMNEDELANAKEELYATQVSSLTPLNDAAYKLAPLGESKAGDRTVVGVKVSHKDHKDV